MADSSGGMKLEVWFDKLLEIPVEYHLLCPRLGDDDTENYNELHDPIGSITLEEKRQRIAAGAERAEITYWNSLIFGFPKKDAGKWLDKFTERLETCLKTCSECALTWHKSRRKYIDTFREKWDDDTSSQFQSILVDLDIQRINQNLSFAKQCIEKIEESGVTFKRKHLGEHLATVHVGVYEALCCMPFLGNPEHRTLFQYVFSRLGGKRPLILGDKTPLPGMTYFLFDYKNEDRRNWALENWKGFQKQCVQEPEFLWAIRDGLESAVDEIHEREVKMQTPDMLPEIEKFWRGVEEILRIIADDLVLSHIRNLTQQINIFELLFRHMQLQAEGVLVACIRVLSAFLRKSPNAIWDFMGGSRPSVIPELLFSNPVYMNLLRQSLDDCWGSFEAPEGKPTPFPISWLEPWVSSLQRNQKHDACDQLLQPLFKKLAQDPGLGEPGQMTCVRAGFDALELTVRSFLEPDLRLGYGTTQLYANMTFNLVMSYRDVILQSLRQPNGECAGWKTLKVGRAAQELIIATIKLDIRLTSDEYDVIHDQQRTDTSITRESKALWEAAKEMFDLSESQVEMAGNILSSLAIMIRVEEIRPRKSEQKLSDKAGIHFNQVLEQTENELLSLLGRFSELDVFDLTSLFQDRNAFQGIVAISIRGPGELSEAAIEALKTWTEETTRDDAFEHISQLHPEALLGSMIWCMEKVLQKPWPWAPINPILNMSRVVLRGLTDPSKGVLRTKALDSKSAAILMRWWTTQWRFVSMACRQIENWSMYIPNAVMTEFCRDIMELAEALMAEDGLICSAASRGKDVSQTMSKVLEPAKQNFTGMENMIRLKDKWLIEVTVRVLCKILKRLRENDLEIHPGSRKLIVDACAPQPSGKFLRSTNLSDQQRAELLQAIGYEEDEVQVVSVKTEQAKKQGNLDAWSKSGSTSSSSLAKMPKTNKEVVSQMSKSADSPILKQLQAQKARPKAPTLDKAVRADFLASRRRAKEEAEKIKEDARLRAKQIRGEIVPGEGSGLSGLGVTGKDHSRSDIYVSSSDEESDEDDGDEGDGQGDQLAAIATGGQKTLTEAEKRRRQALRDKMRGPVKKQRVVRSVNEMRARLKPAMDELHNTVLAWDIFHEGNDPPNTLSASSVATKYPNHTAYQKTFFPLLVSEAWRSFVTAKDEATGRAFGIKVASRASVNNFLEVAYAEPLVKHREKGITEGDILLISEAERPLEDPSARHCLARIEKLKYEKDVVKVTFHVSARNNPTQSILTPGTELYLVKITNMTPTEREYAALNSVQYYDLMSEILNAEPSPILNYSDEKVDKAVQTWALNKAQAKAVLGVQDNDGFTLIQGPPGTGKTKTIIAMVGSLLSEQLAQAANASGATAMRPGGAGNANGKVPKKLLICAPSNAAVDELVLRLKGGITTLGGRSRKINVVRLGRSEAINAAVKDVTLEELVKIRLEGDTTLEKARAEKQKLHEEAGKIKEEINVVRPRMDEARGGEDRAHYEQLSRQFEALKSKQRKIGAAIDNDKANQQQRDAEVNRRRIQQEILNGAHVLCATLSGSGHDMFRNLDVEFETVIIDEAAQCVELSALIPLKYGCCKCILVGDPKQLPPTVLSQSAAQYGYDQSLFVRMQQNHPKSIHLLDMQYRMHPEISIFPSKEFYEGQLQDGRDMQRLRQQPWHESSLLGPYRFFDVQGSQEKGSRGRSLVNVRELEVALQMYERLRKDYQEVDLHRKIGIITPYKAQLQELRTRFRNRYGEGITDIIEFNTTDAFQGRECEIIIFSCVRASPRGGIGFMTDIRRMNVGLTRAKSSLWILGDSRALVQGPFWKKLIEDAKTRQRYTDGDVLSLFRRPLEKVKDFQMLPAAGAGSEIETASDDDVVMLDAAPRAIPERTRSVTSDQPSTNEPRTTSSGSVRPGGPPPIQTSNGKPEESKKRSLASPDTSTAPVIKRIANDRSRGGLAAKFGQKPGRVIPPKAPKPPTDPSAMSVLGLSPPERAAAPSIPTDVPSRPSSTGTGNTPAAGPANGQTQALPKVKKKPKPSLFVPKKR